MKLYLDTIERYKKEICLDSSCQQTSGDVLTAVCNLLQEQGASFDDISEVDYNQGPGSFTGLRVGASIANALKYSLNLMEDYSDLVFPDYGKEPNITKSAKGS